MSDFYSLIRSRIEHEDTLMTQRLSWLIASQSFFFTAYAIVTVNNDGDVELHQLPTLIPLVALITSVLILFTILAALLAIRSLRQNYNATTPPDPALPPIQTPIHIRLLGLTAPLLLPLLFLAVWLYLMLQT